MLPLLTPRKLRPPLPLLLFWTIQVGLDGNKILKYWGVFIWILINPEQLIWKYNMVKCNMSCSLLIKVEHLYMKHCSSTDARSINSPNVILDHIIIIFRCFPVKRQLKNFHQNRDSYCDMRGIFYLNYFNCVWIHCPLCPQLDKTKHLPKQIRGTTNRTENRTLTENKVNLSSAGRTNESSDTTWWHR